MRAVRLVRLLAVVLMCAVIGYTSKHPTANHSLYLEKLFTASQVRGRHAYGIATQTCGGTRTLKVNGLDGLIDELYGLPDKEIRILGHCRYSTSGDYRVQDNNQPISLPGYGMVLVFNGIIDMGTKEEMEKRHGMKLLFENDGEIFLRKMLRGDDVEAWVAEGAFPFAGCYLNKGEMVALRNDKRPLWRAEVDGAEFIASTYDILKRAGLADAGGLISEVPVGKSLCL